MTPEVITKLTELGISGDNIAAARALEKPRHAQLGMSYHPVLHAMLRNLQSPIGAVVEMGCGSGLSTWYINSAMASRAGGKVVKDQDGQDGETKNVGGEGHLFSCDPAFKARDYVLEKFRISEISGVRPTTEGVLPAPERWTFLSGSSPGAIELAAEAAKKLGLPSKWTAFIHDSIPSLLDAEIAAAAQHLGPGSIFVVARTPATAEMFAKHGIVVDEPFRVEGEDYSIWCVEEVLGAWVPKDKETLDKVTEAMLEDKARKEAFQEGVDGVIFDGIDTVGEDKDLV